MPSFPELFAAIFKLALPVGALSFVMVWWALRSGVLSKTDGVRALSKEIDALGKRDKQLRKERKESRKAGKEIPVQQAPRINPVHGKWLKFGGGFYGIVALYTYGLIEWGDVADRISSFGGLPRFLGSISIDLVINIFIEGLLNFVAAISWPVYWMSEFGAEQIWIWIGIAYGGYWLGMRFAQRLVARQGMSPTKSA